MRESHRWICNSCNSWERGTESEANAPARGRLRNHIEPMRKVARTLRSHQELLLNWFRAKSQISSGAAEGLNNKTRVVTRRSYGFRAYEAMEIALYHTLGRLPEPNELTHRFC